MPRPTWNEDERLRLLDRLLEQRTVLLSGAINQKSAERLVGQFLYLDALDSKRPIRFFINEGGGEVWSGFAVFDTIRAIRAPVTTICVGETVSMGTVLMLAPTEKRRRVALPNTRFMIHQAQAGFRGSASDIAIGARELLRLEQRTLEIYAKETGRAIEQIRRDMDRDFWMSADEAVEYGLCHRVIGSLTELD